MLGYALRANPTYATTPPRSWRDHGVQGRCARSEKRRKTHELPDTEGRDRRGPGWHYHHEPARGAQCPEHGA